MLTTYVKNNAMMVILIALEELRQGIATSMAAHTVQTAWMFPRLLGVESAAGLPMVAI